MAEGERELASMRRKWKERTENVRPGAGYIRSFPFSAHEPCPWTPIIRFSQHLRALDAAEREETQADELLDLMLPADVIALLKSSGRADIRFAAAYESTSILFVEICNFASLSALIPPHDLVEMLNTVFTAFDGFCAEIGGVYKVETIGPVYMIACGAPQAAVDHAVRLVELAIRLHEAVEGSTTHDGQPLRLKSGIHSGRIIGGIVGRKLPRFRCFGACATPPPLCPGNLFRILFRNLFLSRSVHLPLRRNPVVVFLRPSHPQGDTINTAARMETSSLPCTLQITEATAALLAGHLESGYSLHDRGLSEIK